MPDAACFAARMALDEALDIGMSTMTQAGGRDEPSSPARRAGNRDDAMTRAAFDSRAASRVPGRLSTPIGTRAAISRQRSH